MPQGRRGRTLLPVPFPLPSVPFIHYAGKTRELRPGDTLVGSGQRVRWRIRSAGLAPRHFTLTVHEDGSTTVRPHSAHTVVAVNGQRAPLAAARLAHGDLISAGSATLRFLERRDADDVRPAAGDASPAFLVDDAGAVAYPLDRPAVRIGRGAGADIQVRDPSVSRLHAKIRAEAGGLVLHSIGSAGTLVNGRRAAVSVLEEGDVVEVGGRTLRFTRLALAEGVTVEHAPPRSQDELSRQTTSRVRLVELAGRRSDHPWWVVAALLGFAIFTALASWLLLQ